MSDRVQRSRPLIVEIVAAGNEVLLGDVLDTNSYWLCGRMTALGAEVRRVVLVRDEEQAIADELRAALARRAQLVLTVGGLGPTEDDLTLRGVALATGRPLAFDAEAERLVREKYEEFFRSGHVPTPGMNEARRKMALLPGGAVPLVNPVGGAPGVWLEVEGCVVVSLPGVPGELRAIVEQSLPERLTRLLGPAHYEERSLVVPALQDESAIAGVLRSVARENPNVYVKSRARQFGEARALRITLSARAADRDELDRLLATPLNALAEGIEAAGFAVEVKPAAAIEGDATVGGAIEGDAIEGAAAD